MSNRFEKLTVPAAHQEAFVAAANKIIKPGELIRVTTDNRDAELLIDSKGLPYLRVSINIEPANIFISSGFMADPNIADSTKKEALLSALDLLHQALITGAITIYNPDMHSAISRVIASCQITPANFNKYFRGLMELDSFPDEYSGGSNYGAVTEWILNLPEEDRNSLLDQLPRYIALKLEGIGTAVSSPSNIAAKIADLCNAKQMGALRELIEEIEVENENDGDLVFGVVEELRLKERENPHYIIDSIYDLAEEECSGAVLLLQEIVAVGLLEFSEIRHLL